MTRSGKDWGKLYELQLEVLQKFGEIKNTSGIYFGGGTALSRFYLDHRFSEDLDFFGDDIPQFYAEASNLTRNFLKTFDLSGEFKPEQYENYSLFYLEKEHFKLKIEIQNYFPKRTGNIHTLDNGIKVDNLQNILINKITTFCNRNEAKDLFDILSISVKYSFEWKNIIRESSLRQLDTDEYSGTKENLFTSINNFDKSKLLKYLESDFFVCYDNDNVILNINKFNGLKDYSIMILIIILVLKTRIIKLTYIHISDIFCLDFN